MKNKANKNQKPLKQIKQNLLNKLKSKNPKQKAKSENKKLRFIGKFEDGKASVALEAIGKEHPFYELQGSENIIAFHTDRYSDPPLVIKGTGAGAAVTAAGILGDIQQCLVR